MLMSENQRFAKKGGSSETLSKHGEHHSWAQRKLSPLSLLNILLKINGLLLSFGFNGLND